jgi:SAM-dependent methyltransferase
MDKKEGDIMFIWTLTLVACILIGICIGLPFGQGGIGGSAGVVIGFLLAFKVECHYTLKKIPLKEGMTVVDYGCGPGRFTIPVAKLTKGKVFAVDINPIFIKTVKKRAARAGLNIEAILGDSYNTGIQGSSIDLVLLIDTLHAIKHRNALFQEIHRILRQGGRIFMDPGHLKISSAKEIVESSGLFTIVECRGKDMLTAPKVKQ